MKPAYRIEAVKGKNYHLNLVSNSNHQVVMTSETYRTWWGCRRAAKKLAAKNGFEYREVING